MKDEKPRATSGGAPGCCAPEKPGGKSGGTSPLKFIGTASASSVASAAGTSDLLKSPPGWVCGALETPSGQVPRISTELGGADRWGAFKSRVSAFRDRYSVPPGLYAVGEPDDSSEVLASANYKLSFDTLRASLKGINAWVLVLDTKGINVWCAAGKGTFSTEELIRRIAAAGLMDVVKHRRVILPQLGAPGVSAHEVLRRTGFRVYFGPVRAADIPQYLSAGRKATGPMRTVRFTMLDRLVLTPMEVIPAMRHYPLYALAVLLVFGLQPSGVLFQDAWRGGLPFLVLGAMSALSGALLTPLLLPYIPSRAFSVKGWLAGLATVFLTLRAVSLPATGALSLTVFSYAFFPLLSSYIALQFTGSTTFTSQAGVKKELRYGVPVYIGGAVASAALLVAFKLSQWGVI